MLITLPHYLQFVKQWQKARFCSLTSVVYLENEANAFMTFWQYLNILIVTQWMIMIITRENMWTSTWKMSEYVTMLAEEQ